MLPVAILAGGLATRLRPITESIPKALVEVAGKPFIEWQLEFLARQGIDRVVICAGYLADQIIATIDNGSQFGLEITYSLDGPRLLGTGGALRQALPILGSEFFVLYGDSFLPIDFPSVEKTYFTSGAPALMTILRNGDRWDKSNVLFKEGNILEYNKHCPRPEMAYIDYGLGILSSSILQPYPEEQAFDLAEVYHALSLTGELAGYEVHERFYEIGSLSGLKETEDFLIKWETKT